MLVKTTILLHHKLRLMLAALSSHAQRERERESKLTFYFIAVAKLGSADHNMP
jgi:hypothetical protein